ncbi:MAG: TasA family protein [Microthrixaceae bacterium]
MGPVTVERVVRPPRPKSLIGGLTNKVLLTLGLVGLTVAAVGAAAVATFTSTTNASQQASSGTVAFASISTNGAGQRLTVAATDIAPGDTIQRAVTLTNTGTIDMLPGAVNLTTSASPSSLLDTGANGLTMVIDKCSVAWTEAGPPYTYTCGGTTTSVLASRPVIGSGVALSNITTTPGTPNFLRVTVTLPTAADNTYQGLTSTLSYLFAGTQRAGTNR